jgi:hypothetical protein
MTSNKIIAEQLTLRHPNSKKSWLQQAFVSEENFVRLTKVIMQIIKQQPLTDYNGNAWISDYSDLTETSFYKSIPKEDPQKLTDNLMKDLQALLKELSNN